ncbi:MAG: amidohydrolase family protein [Planctomycetota bacterium]
MTPVTLTNAILLDLDPPRACPGGVRVEGGQIAAVGDAAVPAGAEAIHDCGGAVVLPGLVNAHTHLYSALAVGMPPPAEPPQNFRSGGSWTWPWTSGLSRPAR